MHWNFGGNFQPVATVCKYSEWPKCLISFIQYVWFEVVTDVADCLANEAILWRVLSALLTILTIAYLAYWRLQWKKEIKKNQEKFKAVNHKIQDIELKVDIVTYKTQYGIWPSQCQEGNTSNNIKNYRFGLSKFTLENSWIKNLLARVDEKKYALEKYSNVQRNSVENYSKINELNFPPSYYDNNLLSDAEKDGAFDYYSACGNNVGGNSGELSQSVDNGRFNPLIIPPESNLSDRSKNHIIYSKKNIGIYDKNLSRRKSIALDNFAFGKKKLMRNKDLKVITSISNMTGFPQAILPESHEKMSVAPGKTSDLLSKPHNTLYEVQKKLKSLYATIHNCNTKNPLVPMLKLDSDSNHINTSKAVSCEVDKSAENTSLLEDSNKFSKDINEQQIAGACSNRTTADTSGLRSLDEMDSKNDDSHLNCNNAEKSFDDSSKCAAKDDEKVKDFVAKKDEINGCHELLELDSVEGTDTENNSENELTPKAFQDVKPLDDATSALLQEALKFKKQILSNVETQSNGIDIKEEHTSNCSETNSESSLRQSSIKFDSKILDKITEESSISSSTEKKGDLLSYTIEDKNKTAQDKTSVLNEKTKRSASKNTDSNFEVLADEKIKKSKEVNCLSKVSNKSSNVEPSSSRKFPASFSSILLCNDQDITNHCKQIHDNSSTLDIKSSQDLASLTESSSDVSVNRLINKLIENERKLKNPNQPLELGKTTNASTQNFTSSDDKKLPNSPVELTSFTVNYDDTVLQQSKIEPIIDEAKKCTGMINEDTSRLECLREIKNVAKKVIDSVLDIKNNENCNRSKLKTYGEIFSHQSSMPKTKCQNTEIIDGTDTSNIDSSTDRCGTYSDSSANEKSINWKSSRMESCETLHTFKESDDTLDSISSNNVQKTLTKHNFEHNWKPSKTKSNLDLTTGDKRQFKSNHRRSKSYVNPRGITDELECHAEHDHVFEPISSSNKLSVVKVLNKKIQDDLQNELDIKTSESSESLCNKSSSHSIKKLIPLKDRPFTLTQECPDSIRIDQNKKSYVTNKSSLELIPLLSRSSSKSSIPVMKNKPASRKSEESFLRIPVESSNLSLENKAQDLIYQVSTAKDEICSLLIDKEKSYPDKFTNFSDLENLKNFEQNAILYYNLVSDDRLISNYVDQKNLSEAIEELNIPDNLVCSRVNNTASAVPETINRPITCVLSDELSELNPLNSFIFQNTIPSMSPYKIERKETEVLVKPSTLDISTSMTNFPCVYHFEEDSKINDVKIFEISDELTKEECIRYLQMFDQDSNHDQSTNTHDFCDKLLEDI